MLSGFSREHVSARCPLAPGARGTVASRPPGGFACRALTPTSLQRAIPSARGVSTSPSPRRPRAGCRNRDRLAIGTRLAALQSPVFLINSRLGRFAAAAASSCREGYHRRRRPFSRSYGASMPSSLTVVLPIASVCSTRPPVPVLVRAPTALPRGFSRKHGLTGFARSLRLASQAPCAADFHAARPTRFHGDVQNPARLPFSVAPSVDSAAPAVRECPPVAHRLRLPASP